METATIVVIGNEVLSGKVAEENAAFLIRELRALGVDLRRVSVVPDEIDDIAEEVRRASSRSSHVFTSGGVGPTHDDVTMAAVARAFGVRVVRHPELERMLRSFYGASLHERNLRMADVPEGARLVGGEGQTWPVCLVENVYVLPGVPELFRRKFAAIRERFRGAPFHLRVAYVNADEGALAADLDRIAGAYSQLRVGSYPRFDAADHRVKLTVEGADRTLVEAAFEQLLASLPAGVVARTE